MPRAIEPGLIVLHGNRLEFLRDAVFDWLDRAPLDPLEEEVVLVQSNGAAEWLKMSRARSSGICAATRVELPGRFLWRAYRQVLGRDRVHPQSALDRGALAWRLMRLLPEQLARPSFAPVAAFLSGDDVDRRLQLARRLADLYDQYQVYRTDWLAAWETGRPWLPGIDRAGEPLPADQRWQMDLWRAIVGELAAAERASTRPSVHRAFVDALMSDAPPAEPLPRRVVLFGVSHLPTQALEALAALSSRVQVVVAVPNPCRYHWADIIEGREALQDPRRRLPSTQSTDLAVVPLDAMHLHAHPLLAAWGRQGRDFMRQLDAFDDAEGTRRRPEFPRIDLFDDGPGTTLLEQVQAAIRDLVPLSEHPSNVIAADDRSIVFHVAHGPQREVEILHDRLLMLLAEAGPRPVAPKDIVVMMPDIETFAPAIRAVFGQHGRHDPRFIPFEIADLRSRGSNPLVVAIEWLLRLPDQRVRLQEVRDLLDVPAVAARFGLAADALPGLFAWLAGAGVRWGLHEDHRAQLGLGATGTQNSWLFGLRRMLLGFASGDAAPFADVQPYDEIGGLDAAVVGSIVDLFERLDAWWSSARRDASPAEWAARARDLLDALVAPTDERERLTLAALQAALAAWLDACALAGFTERVPLAILREGWLDGVDGLDASRRFLGGGVTFCTLMPLRAVPFEVVCLLGMNDGDFPRQTPRNDFDLMAGPGRQRPGDRSRRDDDRYLMLEALLSARRVLYVGWTGRSARDNAVQPPSVLVAQLRDYLRGGFRGPGDTDVLAARTTEHPLQPFSRRYFEGTGLVTFAREWRAAHVDDSEAPAPPVPPRFERRDERLAIAQLVAFLRNPVREFFRMRLDVRVADDDDAVDDDESFGLDGLTAYRLRSELLADPEGAARDGLDDAIAERLRRIRDAGRLPLFASGARVVDELGAAVRPMLERWGGLRSRYPTTAERRPLRFAHAAVVVEDWLDGLRGDGIDEVAVGLSASRVLDRNGRKPRGDKLLDAWVRMLVASACGTHVVACRIGPDATLTMRPLGSATAREHLDDLLDAWSEGMTTPLPFAARTAIEIAQRSRRAPAIYDGGYDTSGEGREFCLRRMFPDYDALAADGGLEHYAHRLFGPLVAWIAASVRVEAHADAAAPATP